MDVDDADDRASSLLDPPPVVENPTDSELVESARGGDSFAVTQLWHRHLAVAWTAARAASGRPDAEPIVVRTAERLIAELREGGGPSGATRPHLLGLVRAAVVEERGRAKRDADAAPPAVSADTPTIAPPGAYADALPAGIGDGTAIAAAYASLPTRWQESLWLAEIDGLSTVELAAELALAADTVESMLADARSALRAEWSSRRLAALPEDSPCRIAAAWPQHSRRARAHLDECDGCRAVSLPPARVSRRALATMPLLLLGAGPGIAFLDAVRPGASLAATEPVSSGGAAARPMPRGRGAAIGATLTGIAATTALVAALIAWNDATEDAATVLAEPGPSADVAGPAPHIAPPEVVTAEAPAESASPPPVASPDPAPHAAPDADGAARPAPGAGADRGASEGPDDATSRSTAPQAAPSPGAQADEAAPLVAELGPPGVDGRHALTVTGEPSAAFSVSMGGLELYAGVLDAYGTAALELHGAVDGVASLTLAYKPASGAASAAGAPAA